MASLNDFIDPDLSAADIQHSSGYVNSDGVGAGGGGLSVEKRLDMSRRSRMVGEYRHSHLGRRYGATKSRTADRPNARIYDASDETFQDKAKFSNRRQGGIEKNKIDSSVAKRQHFIEPPARKYDPYG